MIINYDYYINAITSSPKLTTLFDDLRCCSLDENGQKEGCFSLVFTGRHKVIGEQVVLKFYDPTIGLDEYRIRCFKREPEILKLLKGRRRCLKLIQGLTQIQLEIEIIEGQPPFPVAVEFFVTEWLDESVVPYFLAQEKYNTVQKISLFRNILLSVNMIHKHQVHHRDIKRDNMRISDGLVKLIDFGTAAKHDSVHLLDEYSHQVGAYGYAPPEAFVGFAGEREIGHLSDIYALGCLLFELFNAESVWAAHFGSTHFRRVLTVISMDVATCKSKEERRKAYDKKLNELNHLLRPPKINGYGSTLPKSISGLINRVFLQLIAFDYRSRNSDLESLLKYLDVSISVLTNARWEQSRLARKRAIRKGRQEKVLAQDKRVQGYIIRKRAINA